MKRITMLAAAMAAMTLSQVALADEEVVDTEEQVIELVDDFKGLSVTGILEVARLLPRTYATYRRLVAHAAATR